MFIEARKTLTWATVAAAVGSAVLLAYADAYLPWMNRIERPAALHPTDPHRISLSPDPHRGSASAATAGI